ncbi:VUT family protein [Dactylosporangium sp. NPDC051485]|uniref:VUT family protein n=1 Tax=Dactylosporangium sp. NPDC051485 TaxID=3154846 RepID=UPI003442C705
MLPVLVFIGSVVAANSLTARYGLIPVGFGLTAAAGTAAAGLTLLARDWVHQAAGRATVLACIGTGAVFSATPVGLRLAIASAVAFLVAELVDLVVYQRLRDRGMLRAALASNAVSVPVDSLLFLTLAGFPVWAALPGQLWVKALATIVPVAVFAAARALLRHRLRPARS